MLSCKKNNKSRETKSQTLHAIGHSTNDLRRLNGQLLQEAAIRTNGADQHWVYLETPGTILVQTSFTLWSDHIQPMYNVTSTLWYMWSEELSDKWSTMLSSWFVCYIDYHSLGGQTRTACLINFLSFSLSYTLSLPLRSEIGFSLTLSSLACLIRRARARQGWESKSTYRSPFSVMMRYSCKSLFSVKYSPKVNAYFSLQQGVYCGTSAVHTV